MGKKFTLDFTKGSIFIIGLLIGLFLLFPMLFIVLFIIGFIFYFLWVEDKQVNNKF